MIIINLNDLLFVFQLLADGVIPNEYGINPKQKLKIGSKVCPPVLYPIPSHFSF